MVITTVIAAGTGYITGAFTPAVLRKVKAFFVKETTVLKTDIKADEASVAKKL